MACPFLREAQVKYCRTAGLRKLIPLAVAGGAEEKCLSGGQRTCKIFRAQPAGADTTSGACPYLAESLMQYCAAAPVARLVPYCESLPSRCVTDHFHYCRMYLEMEQPRLTARPADRLDVPDRLRYAPNHMWLDAATDGSCHVGVDAFLGRVLGVVDRLTFVAQRGRTRPAVVVTVAGTDHELIFPNAFLVTGCNLYLRANPARLAGEPYSAGWLFEGRTAPHTLDGLIEGPAAGAWMEREQRRMSEFLAETRASQSGTMADGGLFAEGLASRLERDRALMLFHRFFSPYAGGKRV